MKQIISSIFALILVVVPAYSASVSNIVTMGAASYFGVKTALKCKTAPSAYLFAAGGMMALMGEANANKTHQSKGSANQQAALSSTSGEKQITLTEAALNETKISMEVVAKKRKTANLAKTMFTAAQAVAIAEVFMETPFMGGYPGSLCKGGQASATAGSSLKGLGGSVKDSLNPAKVLKASSIGAQGMVSKLEAVGNTAIGRTIAYLPFTMLAGKVSSDTSKALNNLSMQKNVIQNQIDRTKFETDGGKLIVNSVDIDTERAESYFDNEEIENVTIAEYGLCAFSENGNLIADSACNCKKGDNCHKVDIPELEFNKTIELPSSLTKHMKSMSSYGNALFSGDQKTAKLHARNLLKNAANIEKIRDKLLMKLNKKRKELGMSAISKDGDGNIASTFLKDSSEYLLKKNTKGESLADNIGLLNEPDKNLTIEGAKEKLVAKEDSGKNNSEVQYTTGRSIASTGAAKEQTDELVFDFGEDSESVDEDTISQESYDEFMKKGQALAERDGRKNKTIFEIISNRYIKSAYPVMLMKKKSKL